MYENSKLTKTFKARYVKLRCSFFFGKSTFFIEHCGNATKGRTDLVHFTDRAFTVPGQNHLNIPEDGGR